jgi:hypothetical protein
LFPTENNLDKILKSISVISYPILGNINLTSNVGRGRIGGNGIEKSRIERIQILRVSPELTLYSARVSLVVQMHYRIT